MIRNTYINTFQRFVDMKKSMERWRIVSLCITVRCWVNLLNESVGKWKEKLDKKRGVMVNLLKLNYRLYLNKRDSRYSMFNNCTLSICVKCTSQITILFSLTISRGNDWSSRSSCFRWEVDWFQLWISTKIFIFFFSLSLDFTIIEKN